MEKIILDVKNDIIPENYLLIKEVKIILDKNLEKNYYYLDFIPENIEKIYLICDYYHLNIKLENLPKNVRILDLTQFLGTNKITIKNHQLLNIITQRIDFDQYLFVDQFEELIINGNIFCEISTHLIFKLLTFLNNAPKKIYLTLFQKSYLKIIKNVFNTFEELENNYTFINNDSLDEYTLISLIRKD